MKTRGKTFRFLCWIVDVRVKCKLPPREPDFNPVYGWEINSMKYDEWKRAQREPRHLAIGLTWARRLVR